MSDYPMILEIEVWPELLEELRKHTRLGKTAEAIALYFIVRSLDDDLLEQLRAKGERKKP